MTIEQTVEIPASHVLTLEVPREIPAGKAKIALTIIPEPPAASDRSDADRRSERSEANADKSGSREAFRDILKRTHGAWKDNPWTNHLEDVRAMREEWDGHDPWNPAVQESCRAVMGEARNEAAGEAPHG